MVRYKNIVGSVLFCLCRCLWAQETSCQYEGVWNIPPGRGISSLWLQTAEAFLPYDPVIVSIREPAPEVFSFLSSRYPAGKFLLFDTFLEPTFQNLSRVDQIRLEDTQVRMFLQDPPVFLGNVVVCSVRITKWNLLTDVKKRLKRKNFVFLKSCIESDKKIGEAIFINQAVYDAVF